MTATMTESQPTTATPAVQPVPALPPVEFVMALPEEQRRAVLAALLNEVYATEGDFAAIALRHGDVDLGYLARTQEMLAGCQAILLKLPRDVAAYMCEPLPDDFDPDDCLTAAEFKALNRELAARYEAESRAAR